MADLSSEIANEFWWSKFGYWVLIVGLAGEIFVLRVPKAKETLEKILTLFFVIVIIVGVTLEHNADSAVAELISRQEIDAGITIGALGKDAQASKERAVNAELALAKLQEKIAWRTLNGEQQKRVSSEIRPFAGQQYLLAVSGDPESANFLPTIDAILKDAGWIRLPPSGALLSPDGTASLGIKSKIVALVSESKKEELGSRAVEFAKALNDEGIAASAGYDPTNKNNPEAIEITVGSKPQ